jgi:hypothetical protein
MVMALSTVLTMFDTAYRDLEESFQYRLKEIDGGEGEQVKLLTSQAVMQLSRQQVETFIDKLNDLVNRYAEIRYPDGFSYGFTLVFNPNYPLNAGKTESFRKN